MEVALVCWPGFCSVVGEGVLPFTSASPGPKSRQQKVETELQGESAMWILVGTTESETSQPRVQNVSFGGWGWDIWQEIISEGFQPWSTSRISEPEVLDTCCGPGTQATGAPDSGQGRQRLQVLAGHTRGQAMGSGSSLRGPSWQKQDLWARSGPGPVSVGADDLFTNLFFTLVKSFLCGPGTVFTNSGSAVARHL